MQARRKTRLYIVLAVLAGLGLTVSLTLYALSSNIDLFYTPGKLSTAKRKPGRYLIPGSGCGWEATFSRAPAARPANSRRAL